MSIEHSTVSCVIPTRDRREMVLNAIDSVVRQKEAVEVIVVDDGSIDQTAQAVRRHYPEVTVVSRSGEGPGGARNAGVSKASGDIIMFLDSDDVWLPGHVAALRNVLERGLEVAYGITRNKDLVNGGEFFIPESGQMKEGDCLHQLMRWCFLVPSAIALTRSAFMAVGGFGPGYLGEDWAFFLRLASQYPFGSAGEKPITERVLHQYSLCAMIDRKAILASVRHLHTISSDMENGGNMACRRFKEMEEWVLQSEESWSTVQEWYTAMQRDEMI